jgi:hypothetical protein
VYALGKSMLTIIDRILTAVDHDYTTIEQIRHCVNSAMDGLRGLDSKAA